MRILQVRARYAPLIPPRMGWYVAIGAMLAIIAGAMEGITLILVVGLALRLAGTEDTSLTMPSLSGDGDLSNSQVFWAAFALSILLLAVHLGIARVNATASARVLSQSRASVMRAFSRADWETQAMQRQGSLQEAISGLSTQTAAAVTSLTSGLGHTMALIVLLVLATVIDPISIAVLLVIGAGVYGTLRPLTKVARRLARRHVAVNSTFGEDTTLWAEMAMELRTFGVAQAQLNRMNDKSQNVARSLRKMRMAFLTMSFAYRDLMVLCLTLGTGVLIIAEPEDLASIGAIGLILVRGMGYAQSANNAAQLTNERRPSAERLVEQIRSLEQSPARDGSKQLGAVGHLKLRNVTYTYPDGSVGLTGIDLSIPPGQTLGVIGPSGSGKSTLAQVLLRLRVPQAGAVCVDGVDYTSFDEASWRRTTVSVPQDAVLFEGTVAENITFFRTGITRDQIRRATARAHVLDEVEALPDGFDTKLGPRGTGLSGGQKQRISIARALVTNPTLIVLDEPTSALDVVSEQRFKTTLRELGREATVIVIAHRLTTLEHADRVVALRDGQVVADGTLESVMQQSFHSEQPGDGEPSF